MLAGALDGVRVGEPLILLGTVISLTAAATLPAYIRSPLAEGRPHGSAEMRVGFRTEISYQPVVCVHVHVPTLRLFHGRSPTAVVLLQSSPQLLLHR